MQINSWSIGIYKGPSPFQLEPLRAEPVLTAADVSDMEAQFVADPFMVHNGNGWTMFFEVVGPDNVGVIASASSHDGITWTYDRVVLREPFHLSYPIVFRWQDSWYMVPETLCAEAVRLYRAVSFPHQWEVEAILVKGRHADPTPFWDSSRWWLFTCPRPSNHDTLALFSAPDLTGPWVAHPKSPLIDNDRRIARPGGRIIHWADRIFRVGQDCAAYYGHRVHAFEITGLDPTRYEERRVSQSPLLAPTGSGWNGTHMHHLDAHPLPDGSWLACVDGKTKPAGDPRVTS